MKFLQYIRERFSGSPKKLPVGACGAVRGRFGEDRAEAFCRRELGYRVIARNWRHKRDELDLVCHDGTTLIFIEVRARDASALVSGYHSIGVKKKKALQRAAKSYLKQLQNPPKHFRFDVIDIALTEGEPGKLHHYANIPLFSKHYHPAP
ncbi:MAG: YraN family protein [Opitutales bacterium]